ncbi:uncharacterized protein LY79DRAFT_571691 [Colletotrichum navitas]|uniref:Uncharacterized protein n=1 Tax=Colletotrichum navitas TaxID=681940 RepID=A0AAD8UYC9_9PEZI|nr:uncharacterized protein LY79DRAFT_571691 [Colletotrichum navitas]KAK1569552.1 hypothetical protein LY79DRAFT_571691 [Colletotrichum navitas]
MAMRNVKVHARTHCDTFSHPVDCFSVVRFAIRIPILDIEVNDDDDDKNLHVDDDGHGHQHDDSHGHVQDTQCFELCFHAGFVPGPDPVSLHILPSGRIEHHDPAPLLRTPHPPYYIHELPDLIDLTHTADDAAITTAMAPNPSSSSSSNTPPRLVTWLLLITLYTIAVLTGGVVLGRRLHPSNVEHLSPSSRPLLSLPHATYVLDVAAVPTTRPLSLYEDILSLERLHLAAKADIAEVMATSPDLGLNCELGKLVSRMSRDIFALNKHNDDNNPVVPTPPTLYADIKLTCQHISHRLMKLHRSLRALKAASLYHSDTKLFFTAWMLETAAEDGYDATSLPLAYAKGLLDPERDVWQQCHFCSTPPPAPVDAYVTVLVPDWHFACDMSFLNLSASLSSYPAAAINNYFKSWGKQQSARRFAALRNPPLDVDDTPMYPNNQHPFDEADEIHDALLPGESDLNGLVRNVVEISTAIDELLDLLGTLNISAVSGLQADNAPSPPEVVSSKLWWQIPRSRPAPIAATDRQIRIRRGTARLVNLQNDLLTPLVRSLGRASASMTVACDEANKQRTRVQRLATGRGWDYEAAHINSSSSSSIKNSNGQEGGEGARVSSSSTNIVVHVARTLFTADLAAEASALHAESAQRLAESQSAAAAAKATSTMRLLASRELATAATASSTTTTAAGWLEQVDDDEPMSEEDLAFEQRVREKLDVYDEPMRRLADLLRGGGDGLNLNLP